ncbi:PREDICTED: uncharacterized protein LOC108966845 [Bactrocera latifrons]|uniref:DUF4794 domain-containing protein n=1 Tax=Bactrocera latifrons TaxID=174628 RepID=A0A0K8TX65_BACLA|nr:PREDICTED: uncharacterized protein LOC108966845 [Bactrocera latifrons]
MKFTLVTCLVLSTATAIASALPHHRLQRDVPELVAAQQPAYNYLPPEPKIALPADITATTEAIIAETETPADNAEPLPESAILGADGYEYRAVRRLKYRQRVRRDVSHLSPSYLPPRQSYLPPNADDTVELNAAVPKVAPVYLPPPAEEVSTEVPIVVEEVETEPPAVPEEEVQQQQDEHAQPEVHSQEGEEEAPQDSGILMNDGYHYKQPAEEMALPKAVDSEYLPPLEQGQTEAEGPEETAVLAKDGYHYRAIKRLRL